MNIYAEEGSKVIFAYPENGWDSDKAWALKHLTVGETYTVDYTDVHQSSSHVYLKEVPNIHFNTVQFEDVNEKLDSFIEELTALSEKHGLYIGARHQNDNWYAPYVSSALHIEGESLQWCDIENKYIIDKA